MIAVDQSLSMRESLVTECGHMLSKGDVVTYAVNRIISEMMARATREGKVRDYYDIAVMGYSSRGVESLLGGVRKLISISELSDRRPEKRSFAVNHRTAEGGSAVMNYSFDMWIEPSFDGSTPMYEALSEIRDLVGEWCAEERNAGSFPPVVINITDGEVSDADCDELRTMADGIKSLRTDDGNVLLMNIHITAAAGVPHLLFPTEEEVLSEGNRYARLLADCSSVMPEPFAELIRDSRGDSRGSRRNYLAMGYNSSAEELFVMLNIGSRSVNGAR